MNDPYESFLAWGLLVLAVALVMTVTPAYASEVECWHPDDAMEEMLNQAEQDRELVEVEAIPDNKFVPLTIAVSLMTNTIVPANQVLAYRVDTVPWVVFVAYIAEGCTTAIVSVPTKDYESIVYEGEPT